MSIGPNIRRLRKASGLTLNQLATIIDSDVGNLSRLERGIQGFTVPLLAKIAEALNVSVMELFRDDDGVLNAGGEGETNVFWDQVHDVTARLRNLAESDAEIQAEAPPPAAAPDQTIPGGKSVRVIDEYSPGQIQIRRVKLMLQAGITGFVEVPDNVDGGTLGLPKEWVERKGFDPQRLISMGVKGESMEPTIYEGDTVVINLADTKPVDNGVYAFNYGGEPVVKRLSRDMGKWWLMSDNADQRRFYRRACQGTECMIIGRVVRRIGDHL